MESKVAVFGGEDFVMPFSALGLDTYAAVLANVVFEAKQRQAVPCVVVVPFATESEGFATKTLGKMLKIATGIDILAN